MQTFPCCPAVNPHKHQTFRIDPAYNTEYYPEETLPAAERALYLIPSAPENDFAQNTTAWD